MFILKRLLEKPKVVSVECGDGRTMKFEVRIQRYDEQTGQPVEPTPYKILTAVIGKKENHLKRDIAR